MRRIFYCWQSDVKPNRGLIRGCLESAVSEINKDLPPDLHFFVDEAARDVLGSPSLDAVIMEKIEASEIVVGDVTPITSFGDKEIPNPNVVLEVGHAAAYHGWGRTLLVWNKDVVADPAHFPFDMRNRLMAGFDPKDKKGLTRAFADELKRRAVGGSDSVRRAWLEERISDYGLPVVYYCLAHGSGLRLRPADLRRQAWAGQPSDSVGAGLPLGLGSDPHPRRTWIESLENPFDETAISPTLCFAIREDGSIVLAEGYMELRLPRKSGTIAFRAARLAGFLAYVSVFLRRIGIPGEAELEIGARHGDLEQTPMLLSGDQTLVGSQQPRSTREASADGVETIKLDDLPGRIPELVTEILAGVWECYAFDNLPPQLIESAIKPAMAYARG